MKSDVSNLIFDDGMFFAAGESESTLASATSPSAAAWLVQRAHGGDERAIAALERRYLRAAYLTALAIVMRPPEAEDAARDAFAVAIERIEQCGEPARFAAWFLQLVRRRALNEPDSRPRARRIHEERALPTPRVSAALALRQPLLIALAGLSEVQREIVLLHEIEAWTHAELADALGISESLSREHLSHARRTLQARLSQFART
ncbi:MAG TPA: sigma-70 family RNA polymerase sigma factor [Polyangiales bacterium]|jgi:RNA polymerase sigma-70 factor (ECF subfamily)